MKKDRQVLESNIVKVLNTIKPKRKMIEEVNQSLFEYNMSEAILQQVANDSSALSEMDASTLCLLSLALYQTTQENAVSPYDFFTDNEITRAKEHVKENNEDNEIKLPLTLEYVQMLDYENFITKISMVQLVNMFHSQLIIYDYDTQRSAKYVRSKDGVVPVPDVNKKSVADIAQNMIKETYLADMITLNVYSTEIEPIDYDDKNKTLTINEGAVISILDGFHRLQAGVRAVAINPNLDLEMILSIRSYDSETAKKYFGQINTINVVKQQRLKELKSEKQSDIVVRDLQLKSELTGKIASSAKVSELAGQLTTFDVLSYAIGEIWNPQTKIEAKQISKYLVNFFDYLVGSYVEEFRNNPNEYRHTYINHPLMFIAYVQIAKKLYDNDIELSEIKKHIDKIDFNDPKLLEILNDKRGINNRKTRHRVINHFSS
ncbi:DNA sulfur modification protein DndB [Paenibacillus sp. JSM ZJ436]|uniref:DNA sulfur modification protein DndB n=1 Tax=Paenibacillus sp. JSM ZJ436 TaxID=3376190 RepID=UPI00379501FF